MGIRIFLAGLCPTAAAMAGEISPISASAMTMPSGPRITSAFRQATIRAFSPVAPWAAPPFSRAAVAMLLVPTARTSTPGNRARMARTSC